MSQWGLTDQPYRLVTAGDGPSLIVNRDLTNQVMVGSDSGIEFGNANQVSVIDPLGSIAVSGDDDVWAIRVPGATDNPMVDVMQGATYWAPSPAQVAAQINALGLAKDTSVQSVLANQINGSQIAGLIANPQPLYQINNQTILQNTSPILVPVNAVKSPIAGYATIDEFGYELCFTLINVNTATNNFVRIDINFYDQDSLTAVPIDIETWYLPVAASGGGNPCIITGKGPLRGVYCDITATLPSPGFANSGSIVLSLQMFGTGRAYSRDQWYEQSPYQTLGGTNSTRPGGVAGFGSNSLWSIASQTAPSSIAAGQGTQRLLPLMSGKQAIRLGCTLASGGNVVGFHFYPQNSLNNAGGAAANPILEIFLGSTTALSAIELWFPNDPVNLFIQNNAAVAATIFATAVNEQY